MQAVDDTGFKALMDQHAPSVRGAIRAVLGRSADEDDLVQEVFTRLLVRLRQDGGVDVGPWCRRAARNLAIDHLRRRRATPTEDRDMEQPCGDGLDREVMGRDMASKLALSLQRIPDQHRRVLLAQMEPGENSAMRTHAEIGAAMGLSPKATESLLARARQRLRAEMLRQGVDGAAVAVTGATAATAATAAVAAGAGQAARRGPSLVVGLAARAKLVMAGAAVIVSGTAAGMATAPLLSGGLVAHGPVGGPVRPPATGGSVAHGPVGGPGRSPVASGSAAPMVVNVPTAPGHTGAVAASRTWSPLFQVPLPTPLSGSSQIAPVAAARGTAAPELAGSGPAGTPVSVPGVRIVQGAATTAGAPPLRLSPLLALPAGG